METVLKTSRESDRDSLLAQIDRAVDKVERLETNNARLQAALAEQQTQLTKYETTLEQYGNKLNWRCSNDEMCGKSECDCPKDRFAVGQDGYDLANQALAADPAEERAEGE